MLASVDTNSSVPVFVQIENHIQFAIASGAISAGDQLPSVRELSERLDVNPNTVSKAYRDLEVLGLLFTKRGTGVFVNKGVEAKCRDECRKRIVMRLHEVTAEAKAAGMTKREIQQVLDKSFASNASLYTDPPASVKALARRRRPR